MGASPHENCAVAADTLCFGCLCKCWCSLQLILDVHSFVFIEDWRSALLEQETELCSLRYMLQTGMHAFSDGCVNHFCLQFCLRHAKKGA